MPFTLPAAHAGVDGQSVSYIFHHFSDVDGVNVSTHYANTGLKLDNGASLSFRWAHDVVVLPGIEAAPGSQDAVDAITTASRPIAGNSNPFEDFVKVRDEFAGSGSYGGFQSSYYASKESDYFAQMVSAGYNHSFLRDNLNLSVGASYSWDAIDPLEDSDTAGIPDHRKTWHGNVVATQILTPTTVVRIGAEYNRVRGLQHDPYRNVYVAGANAPEAHPGHRERRDVFFGVTQYINNRSSIKFDYRYYTDDWGVSSNTYGGKLSQYVTDEVVIRYRYRYYTQVPAYFFLDDYTSPGGVQGFQTNDYRLGNYGAHLFGGRILWTPNRLLGKWRFPERAQLIFGYERYFNSNNFTANIIETGLRISF